MTHSRNLRGKALIEYKASLKLNDFQRQVLVGTLLGDASMAFTLGKPKYNVKFEQQISKQPYIEHLYEIFEPFVGTSPKIRNIKGGGAQDRQSTWFRTYGHPAFKFYDDSFYGMVDGQRRKCVPKTIQRLFTPISLAYWFMDDGTYSKRGKRRYYRFSTQGFCYTDQKRLVESLRIKFGIQSAVHKDRHQYHIGILSESNGALLECIQTYVQPCFIYKLNIEM